MSGYVQGALVALTLTGETVGALLALILVTVLAIHVWRHHG